MAKEDNKLSFDKITADLKAGRYAPIYFLMGDEPYFIDKISDYIEQNAVAEDERDMNQTVMYGKDVKIEDVIIEARRYPFMAERRVVIVKEAQNLKRNIDKLELYLKAPVQTTTLVFCYKYDKLDGRKKYVKEIERIGVLFHSATIYDDRIPEWIVRYCSEVGVKINAQAANMLANNIGNDLLRIAGEIDKLKIAVNDGRTDTISPEIVERNVGISKEYNNFELTAALGKKDALTVYRIVDYFGKSPKNFVIQVTLAVVYNFFVNLLHYHLLKDKSPESVSQRVGINRFFVKDFAAAARLYSPAKIRRIIGYIRDTDAKSKGFGSTATAPEDLLKELCFRILN